MLAIDSFENKEVKWPAVIDSHYPVYSHNRRSILHIVSNPPSSNEPNPSHNCGYDKQPDRRGEARASLGRRSRDRYIHEECQISLGYPGMCQET